MGFNYEEAGYNSVKEIALQYALQVKVNLFLNYIQSQPKILKAFQKKDFTTFMLLYNRKKIKTPIMIKKIKNNMKNYLNKAILTSIILIFTANFTAQHKLDLKQGIYDDGQLEVFITNNNLYGYINIDEEINCKVFFGESRCLKYSCFNL